MSFLKVFRLLLIVTYFATISCTTFSDKYLEEKAINTLDATTKTIGNMTSCSLRIINESTEVVDGESVLHVRQSDVYLRGSNSLHVYVNADDVRKGLWYNGEELSVFRFDENTYDVTVAPANTIAMIDSIHSIYGVDFPAADIFYPTLTDDVIANFDSVFYLGTQEVNGILCKGVNATNATLNVWLYVDDATNLPVQLAIYGKGTRDGEVYVSNYQDWQINPALGDEIFKFSPPANATKAAIFKKD